MAWSAATIWHYSLLQCLFVLRIHSSGDNKVSSLQETPSDNIALPSYQKYIHYIEGFANPMHLMP
jgi:hypothetical protein